MLGTGVSKGMITMSSGLFIADIVDSIVLGIVGGAVGGMLGAAADAARAVKAGVQIAETVALEGAEFAADEAVTVSEKAVASSVEKAGLEEAGEEIAAKTTGKGMQALKSLGGMLNRNCFKILGSMLGAGMGTTIALIPEYLKFPANKDAQMSPSLAPFLGAIAVNMQWPNSVQPKVISAQFNGCLQLGVDPGFRF